MFDPNPNARTTTRSCEICGYSVWTAVATMLVRYRGAGEPFKAIVRCTDRAACRKRYDRTGQRWPLIEAGEHVGLTRPIEVERRSPEDVPRRDPG